MKRITLLLVGLLFTTITTQASNSSELKENREGLTNRYRYAEPILFVERGVEFFIFPNGEFDFNTHPRFRRNRRSVNTTYGAPRTSRRGSYTTYGNRGVRVEHDEFGRVRSIGNLFLNYDRFGRIKRIGSIYMTYNRGRANRTLSQIGGMTVRYNRWGKLIYQHGSIKPIVCDSGGISSGGIHDDTIFDDPYENDGYFDEEDQYYYRKKDAKKKKK